MKLSLRKVTFVLAGAMALGGAALFAAPAPHAEVSSFGDGAAEQASDAPATATEALDALFDLAALPEEVAPAPPPRDEAEGLLAHRFLGGAASGDKSAALFAREGRVLMLRPGETLEGFELLSFDGREARFSKGNREITLAKTEG